MNENKNSLNYLIKFFESKEGLLLALMFALITQLGHSIIAYATIDTIIANDGKVFDEFNERFEPSFMTYIFGFMFSVAISLAIIIFTIREKKLVAYFFVVVEASINIVYAKLDNSYSYWTLLSIVFFGVIIPVTIAAYSHQTNEERMTDKEKKEGGENTPVINPELETQLEAQIEQLKEENNKLTEIVNNKVDRNARLKVDVYTSDRGILPYEMKFK